MSDKNVEKRDDGKKAETSKVPAEEPKKNEAETAPVDNPEKPALPPGVHEIQLSDKDIEKLAKLDELEQNIGKASLQVVMGLARVLGQVNQLDTAKNQTAAALKEKYELPEDAPWQADYRSGKLMWKEVQPPVAVPTPEAPKDDGDTKKDN